MGMLFFIERIPAKTLDEETAQVTPSETEGLGCSSVFI